MTDYILVCVTTSSPAEAEQIAHALVAQQLAACGNIIPDIRSIFRWQQAIETAPEALLILKSRASLFPALATAVKRLHSYDVPEIIALPMLAGAESYLAWLAESTAGAQQ